MRKATPLAVLTILAACSGETEEPPIVRERDPATVQALNHQIMTDPDLAGLNEANAALTGGFDHSLPPIVDTPEAIDAARREAAEIVGGSSNLADLGQPEASDANLPEVARFVVTELARVTVGTEVCAAQASYTASWAARMPQQFPIYPRGNVIEAAGSDDAACSLRAIRFLTPVPREDLFAFYAARAKAAGLPARYSETGDFHRMEGAKGARKFAVVARQRASGISEVGLVTTGFGKAATSLP
ncbi:hypothetical protein [Erythrobacter litoralis]|uniref:Lipoprotein n=1 Tax=Erythrobacter litoralis (strain HTCC2594) TaxID=314225 RepID=Q2NCC6_ERYLH|nr:hypothetical protein [Erythrobacter litoralis]ABC62665.1 hypothetical protein ELI_02865 [Erythrobacter litoralis HTCC2594]